MAKKTNTKYLKFKGRVAWTMLYSPDDYKGNKFWKLSLYPTDEVIQKIKDAGIQTKLKEDDGSGSGVSGKYFQFRRDTEKKFDSGMQKFAPPSVYMGKSREPVVSYEEDAEEEYGYKRIGDPILIGNGSEVEVTLEIYPTGSFGKGTRLNSVRILDLIEYNPDAGEEDEDDEPTPKAMIKRAEFNDEIPF